MPEEVTLAKQETIPPKSIQALRKDLDKIQENFNQAEKAKRIKSRKIHFELAERLFAHPKFPKSGWTYEPSQTRITVWTTEASFRRIFPHRMPEELIPPQYMAYFSQLYGRGKYRITISFFSTCELAAFIKKHKLELKHDDNLVSILTNMSIGPCPWDSKNIQEKDPHQC